jgi:hypothetical protein
MEASCANLDNPSNRAPVWALAFKHWLMNLTTLTRRIDCSEPPRSRGCVAVPICRTGGNDPNAVAPDTLAVTGDPEVGLK